MMSLTCKTAIKAVIFLASKRDSGEKLSIKEIAAFIAASEHTVGKLLQTLVKKQIINSAKGPAGGFYISASQYKKPMIRIIEAIDGPEVFKECGLGLKKCSSDRPCPIHHDFKEIRDRFEAMCRKKTLDDLCGPMNIGLTYLTV
jgi:Rrf2 family protein